MDQGMFGVEFRTRSLTVLVMMTAAMILGVGAAPAAASTTALPIRYDKVVTDDGWKLQLRAHRLVIQPVSNIANSFASREGWVSAKISALITPASPTRPITESINVGVIEQVLTVGCQIDVSDGATFGMGSSFGPTAGVTISQWPSANIGGSATVSPSISSKISPGKIAEISLGRKQLTKNRASISVKRARISVDGCAGPVTVRLVFRFSVSSNTADDTLYIRSTRMWL